MNGEFIYNETLTGTINGTNKVFTTLYNIEKIEDVYYGGAPYRDVSFVGNAVTFGTAPTTGTPSPKIDYFRVSASPLPEFGDVTFGEIIDDVYDKLGQDRIKNTVANKVYKESLIKKYINNGFARIKNLRLYKDIVQQYSFNKAKDGTVIGYNASYITIGEDLDYIPSSGVVLLRNDTIVEYSNYVDGKLMGAAGIVYENNDKYSIGYKIPSGIKKVMEVILDGEVLNYYDIREYSINKMGYTIYKKSNGDDYIILPYLSKTDDNKVATVKYQATYSEYSADEDVVGIEREYYEVLSFYVLRKLFQYREDDRWQQAEKDYRELLREYKSYKSRAVDGINNSMKSSILTDF